MEFITGRVPGASATNEVVCSYLRGLREEINHALESIAVSSGERDGWTWRKNADGTVECWRRLVCPDVCCCYGGYLFFESDKAYGEDITYPFKFTERPYQQLSISSTDGVAYRMQFARFMDTNIGKIWFVRQTQQTDRHCVEVDIYIRGGVAV